MKVRMKVDTSGTYNGDPWPPIGGVIDVPDTFGQRLIDSKRATAVKDDDDSPSGDHKAGEEHATKPEKSEKRGGLTKSSTGL